MDVGCEKIQRQLDSLQLDSLSTYCVLATKRQTQWLTEAALGHAPFELPVQGFEVHRFSLLLAQMPFHTPSLSWPCCPFPHVTAESSKGMRLEIPRSLS